jgi:hypothetical protein
MAQVDQSEAVSLGGVGKIEVSTNDSDWLNISGYGFTVTPSGGSRMTGEMYTLDGELGIPTVGKREPIEIEFTGLYTEDASAPYTVVWDQYTSAGGGALWVKYSARAGTTGDYQYSTDQCVILACLPPAVDPSSGDPTPFSFTVRTKDVTRATIT